MRYAKGPDELIADSWWREQRAYGTGGRPGVWGESW